MNDTPLADLLLHDVDTGSWREPPVPSAAQVAALQGVRGYPCISVLLGTTPGPRLTPTDITRLQQLLGQASDRLRTEPAGTRHEDVMTQLEGLAAQVITQPAAAGLALYAGAEVCEVVHLPVPVRDRVVIDPTFATRDLVRSLHQTPRHVVLVLTAAEARLFHGVADTLQPALRSRFPIRNESTGLGGTRGDGARTGKEGEGTLTFLRTVDRALGAALRIHPSPLVLVGPERLLATFRATSRNLDRLAGTVTGSHVRAPLHELARVVRPVLDTYLHSRQAEALHLLDRRIGARRAVTGMADAWFAANRERPEMLVVEDTLLYPARLAGGGHLLTPAEDVDAPDVIDDAVDELIEIVLQRGGWVALAEDGALAQHDRVALTLRNKD